MEMGQDVSTMHKCQTPWSLGQRRTAWRSAWTSAQKERRCRCQYRTLGRATGDHLEVETPLEGADAQQGAGRSRRH